MCSPFLSKCTIRKLQSAQMHSKANVRTDSVPSIVVQDVVDATSAPYASHSVGKGRRFAANKRLGLNGTCSTLGVPGHCVVSWQPAAVGVRVQGCLFSVWSLATAATSFFEPTSFGTNLRQLLGEEGLGHGCRRHFMCLILVTYVTHGTAGRLWRLPLSRSYHRFNF